jgi:aubergine-like protein
LAEVFREALNSYQSRHAHGEMPDNFVIYRDGVGDAMRRQVLDAEITQMKGVIKSLYNSASKPPNFTVVIVNKRINQRFFVDNGGN